MFDKQSEMTLQDFYNSAAYDALVTATFPLTEWIKYTNEEKANDKAKKLIGGYLKVNTMRYAWAELWKALNDDKRQLVMNLPNFDKDVFKKITGIEVEDTKS